MAQTSRPGWAGLNAIRSVETTPVHHAARRRGRVAARGARAAASEASDHRFHWREHAFGLRPMGCPLRAATTRAWVDRGAHDRDRISLGGRTQRALPRD